MCSMECAKEYAAQKRLKKERKEYREQKRKQLTLSEWLKKVEHVFNAYIRARDIGNGYGCISCGTHSNVQYAAGHYRTVKACPELRFNELNVHLQCNRRCNKELSGNILEYRKSLIERVGIEKVEWLEGPHNPMHYTIADCIELERLYKKKLKELKENNHVKEQ